MSAAAVPALAASGAVNFTIADRELAMPVPAGYCLPEGIAAEIADMTARTDKDNKTLASFVDCKGQGTQAAMVNYVLVKSPNSAAEFTMDKTEALDMLTEAGTSPDAPKFDEAMASEMADNSEEAFGKRIELTGNVGYAGRDADCVYLAGRLALKSDPGGKSLWLGACMTVVGGKVLTVYRYDARSTAKIADLKAHAKMVALSIHP
ncbi:MAG: hypothetical protein WBL74_07145 [Novosphingobium sp.]|uniref:hypothetical protein n=1 Tax=Novosphingobium sp. TaxID=1874826 RepID=UPI003C7B9D98